MKTCILFISIFFSTFQFAQAKIWRVNNNPGISANFSSLSSAFSSSSVLEGDTLYVEGSSSNYLFTTLSKRLVIIGPGYFLSGTGMNPNLQYGTNPATINIVLDSLASGSEFHGIQGDIYMNSNTDAVKFIRCNISVILNSIIANSRSVNNEFRQCFLSISFSRAFEDFVITNCIITNLVLNSAVNGLIRNNTISGACTVNNSYISNNIFLSSISLTNCTVKNNVSIFNNLPANNNNLSGIPITNIIVNAGSADGKYILSANSVARSAGETINGVTPDMGAFGTGDPYRLSGIPAIPSIYALVAPSSVPATATSMTVTISTRSNN